MFDRLDTDGPVPDCRAATPLGEIGRRGADSHRFRDVNPAERDTGILRGGTKNDLGFLTSE